MPSVSLRQNVTGIGQIITSHVSDHSVTNDTRDGKNSPTYIYLASRDAREVFLSPNTDN